jgi:hypothetical protein
MKNAVIWDVTPCGSNNRHFGGTCRLYHYCERIVELGTMLAVT